MTYKDHGWKEIKWFGMIFVGTTKNQLASLNELIILLREFSFPNFRFFFKREIGKF